MLFTFLLIQFRGAELWGTDLFLLLLLVFVRSGVDLKSLVRVEDNTWSGCFKVTLMAGKEEGTSNNNRKGRSFNSISQLTTWQLGGVSEL